MRIEKLEIVIRKHNESWLLIVRPPERKAAIRNMKGKGTVNYANRN